MGHNLRYAPHRSFPPWIFIPGGAHPHPEKEGGYSCHKKTALSQPLCPDKLHVHPDYLYALDLFNHRYGWEAHVWLELLWNELGRRGNTADFLKALIKICAAQVKEEMNSPQEARAHLARALELLQNIPKIDPGLDITPIKNILATGNSPFPLRLREQSLSLGGGCFWGVQHALSLLPGVLKTVCGYQGGHPSTPSYKQVCKGDTGHAEVVHILFVPSILPLERLLQAFMIIHDPTQKDRQGADVGSQYRSSIFCQNPEQLLEVQQFLERTSPLHIRPLATETTVNSQFYPAEEYHQDYLNKTPGGYCHIPTDIFDRIRRGQF